MIRNQKAKVALAKAAAEKVASEKAAAERAAGEKAAAEKQAHNEAAADRAAAERSAATTTIHAPPAVRGCDEYHFSIRNDGTGGQQLVRKWGARIPDGQDHGLTLRK